MRKKQQNLPEALGVENEDQIIENCLMLQVTEEDISSILKKILCSNYNSKEMLYAAYVVGKMQNSSKEQLEGVMMLSILKNLKKLMQEKDEE
jgi:hypothetical protein